MQPSSFFSAAPLQPKHYHLFISHSWDYGDDRTNLASLIVRGLDNSPNIWDYSAPKDNPIHTMNQIELIAALYDRINKANVLIFPAGVYASYSKWIPIEIAIAQESNKPIIAVEKWGSQRSTDMTKHANEIVGWNSSTVGKAIRAWHG